MIRREGYFKGYAGAKLFYQLWTPPEPRGLLTITHGQGEHSDSYARVVEALRPLSWEIVGWDLRGHGRSEGERGAAPSFDSYVHDYECFLAQVVDHHRAGRKIAHLAHSLGGLIHLKVFLANPELRARPQILSSPLLGLSYPVTAHRNPFVKNLARLLPKFTVGDDLIAELLTRDPAVAAEFKKDPLRHGKISAEVYVGALEAIDAVLKRAELLDGPLLAVLPEKDLVVNSPATIAFVERASSPKKVLKVYSGRKHELFNDLGREEVFEVLREFLRGI